MANEKRLIDANAVLKWLDEITDPKEWLVSQYNADWIWSVIDSAPTVDAVPVVHGRWHEFEATDGIVCSECGRAWNIIDNCTETFNYCPNCGAKMDGDGNA